MISRYRFFATLRQLSTLSEPLHLFPFFPAWRCLAVPLVVVMSAGGTAYEHWGIWEVHLRTEHDMSLSRTHPLPRGAGSR